MKLYKVSIILVLLRSKLAKGEYSVRGSTFLPNPDPYFFLDFREQAKLNTVQIDTCGYNTMF